MQIRNVVPRYTLIATLSLAFFVVGMTVLPSSVEAAYPTVAATSTGNSGANTTASAITMPSGISNGDLLIVIFSIDGTAAPTSVTGTGWTAFGGGAGADK